jgi:hypothetical protein
MDEEAFIAVAKSSTDSPKFRYIKLETAEITLAIKKTSTKTITMVFPNTFLTVEASKDKPILNANN